ncbi:MAG: hypothetical protein MJ225_04405 [Bacilli bacterium]|nr:hypothetical protein [Bacilli bacterium]
MKKTLILILVILTSLILCGCDMLTEEEVENYHQSKITEYEVLSVGEYIKVRTNSFGGVVGHDSCYTFTYVDNNGVVHTRDNFENLEYGNQKVKVGNENKYVWDEYEQIEYLYLTKDTLSSIMIENK